MSVAIEPLSRGATPSPVSDRLRAAARSVKPIGIFAALLYFVLIGGTATGEVEPTAQLINALLAGSFIAMYVRWAPESADSLDRWMLVAVVLFAIAAAFSMFPRQSFDAAVGALAWCSALFVARRLSSQVQARRAAIRALVALSAIVTLVTAARWLPLVVEWWALTDWTVVPPLDLNLPAAPWGHRHDLALLVAILYPSWWIARPGRLMAAAAAIVGVCGLAIVLVDGSRTVWFALAAASGAVLLPKFVRPLMAHTSTRLLAAVLIFAVVAAGVASGIGGAIAERLATGGTLSARSEMWQALVGVWLDHPLTGVGPGGFPWTLQLTGYFDQATWAPRHPDSAFFQLLGEAGIFGLAGGAVISVAVARGILTGYLPGATWTLTAVAIASVGANPTDFGFLVAVAIVWFALLTPSTVSQPVTSLGRPFHLAAFGACAIIAIAFGSMLLGSYAYSAAREHVNGGRLGAAERALSLAIQLDPGLALYVRQRGTLHLIAGRESDANLDLNRAVQLNPYDDLAWRVAAMAEAAGGNAAEALAAGARAWDVQRIDPANALLLAHLQTASGRIREAEGMLATVVIGWPHIVAAPGWTATLPPTTNEGDVLVQAVNEWRTADGLVPTSREQALVLHALAVRAGIPPGPTFTKSPLEIAWLAVETCSPRASALISAVGTAEKRTAEYWALMVAHLSDAKAPTSTPLRLLRIMTGEPVSEYDLQATLNPVREGDGFSADVWGYRRLPIAWPAGPLEFPSPRAGRAAWLFGNARNCQ